MTNDDDDIVRVVLRAALAAGVMTRDEAMRLDQQVRNSHGGSRYYVPKRIAEGKAAGHASALAAGQSIQSVIEESGCHRATLYRRLGRWVMAY